VSEKHPFVDTPCTSHEIIALERSDVDFKRNQITVRQSDWQGQIDTPKSG
jgi:integrase